jgi:hypothetical protein
MEKILVVFLAVFFFAIAGRLFYTGPSGILKGSIAVLVGVVCLLAFRKAPMK